MLIVGAGIHGVGVAQAAAARGYRVVLLEKSAPASGTSSRSSKLIHGGLRYLESAQFGLVRECLHERRVLLQIAPELVQLRPFNIPIYCDTRRRPWQIGIGLSLYTLLGGFRRDNRFTPLARREWAKLDGITTDGLQTVFRYFDAQTDDAALTCAVLHSAQGLGAELRMPACFSGAEIRADTVHVRYRMGETDCECAAKMLVNAAGPWVNEILARTTPVVASLAIDLVQGAHIVLPGTLTQGLYYLESPIDARAVFAMPWQNKILVGTTETIYRGSPDAVQPLASELDYLLNICARYFPGSRAWTPENIETAFAGLRVLPARGGSAFVIPRETVLHVDMPRNPRVLTIYGGKLTAYRATAEHVMRRLSGQLPTPRFAGDTSKLKL